MRGSLKAFNVTAYRKDDALLESDLRREEIPVWNLNKAVDWAVGHGMDTILIELSPNPAEGIPGITHHFACSDPTCPGRC